MILAHILIDLQINLHSSERRGLGRVGRRLGGDEVRQAVPPFHQWRRRRGRALGYLIRAALQRGDM